MIGNLNPNLVVGLYECVDSTSCSTIGAERFVATCLADAAKDVEPSPAVRDFCKELETAADDCSYTDYDKQACWKVSAVYSDAVLASAVVCAKKECGLIIECVDATLKLPTEPDGSPIGFDGVELSSGAAALPATAAIFPKTATTRPVPPDQPSTNETLSTSDDRTTEPQVSTSEPLVPTSAPSTQPKIDITDPDVQKEYCVADDRCTDCSFSACCIELLTCLTNDACVDWIGCVADCPNDDTRCERDCRSAHASGEDAALDYLSCFDAAAQGACAPACAAPNPDDTSSGATNSAATSAPDPEIPTEGELNTSATDATAADTTPLDTTTDVTTATPPDSTSSSDDTSNPTGPTCTDCLLDSCGEYFEACFSDAACIELYYLYVDCLGMYTLAVEVNACITPYLDLYETYFPLGTLRFYAMDECLATADCPVCDG